MTAPASAPPDFSTLGAQLAYWLGHIGQTFKGGFDGSGENGVDIGMPTGTPVYALSSGTIKGQGYYGGGGVVSIREQPGRVWYYQHLDLIEPGIEQGQTKQIQKGQLIGWSGGQSGYGRHPVTSLAYSNDGHGNGWPHIEVGINAPWGGIWGGGEGPNVDPMPALRALSSSSATAPTGSLSAQAATSVSNPLDWMGQLKKQFGTLFTWFSDPLRIVKLIGGGLLMGAGVLLFLLPSVAGPGLQIAGLATASPELTAIGSAFTRPRGVGARTAEGYGKGRAATRVATEKGRQSGVAEQVEAQHQKASDAAKKGWETRRAAAKPPKPRGAAVSTEPAAEEDGEPVYLEGKRVGTFQAGKVLFNRVKAPPPPTAPPLSSFVSPEQQAREAEQRQKRQSVWSNIDDMLNGLR